MTAAVVTVLGVADECASAGTCGSSDGGTFEAASRLMANNAAEGGPTEASDGCTTLGVWAHWFSAIAEEDGADGGYDNE